ncbi:hypothetical protein HZU75_06555 [Chitinibacter fontanus]|uniref:Uncharacterized protein n=1 Tax=Chitinibacter fontanus TaxID=1737446 RepID=A0A7D5V985_9NEIS|nr:hypothetical protein [Chitinibacter fontanus]QLI81219.1 hypothetical protein HZU75_06555 [Chitinibacter fontanus]
MKNTVSFLVVGSVFSLLLFLNDFSFARSDYVPPRKFVDQIKKADTLLVASIKSINVYRKDSVPFGVSRYVGDYYAYCNSRPRGGFDVLVFNLGDVDLIFSSDENIKNQFELVRVKVGLGDSCRFSDFLKAVGSSKQGFILSRVAKDKDRAHVFSGVVLAGDYLNNDFPAGWVMRDSNGLEFIQSPLVVRSLRSYFN